MKVVLIPIDGPTNKAAYRVASSQLKIMRCFLPSDPEALPFVAVRKNEDRISLMDDDNNNNSNDGDDNIRRPSDNSQPQSGLPPNASWVPGGQVETAKDMHVRWDAKAELNDTTANGKVIKSSGRDRPIYNDKASIKGYPSTASSTYGIFILNATNLYLFTFISLFATLPGRWGICSGSLHFGPRWRI